KASTFVKAVRDLKPLKDNVDEEMIEDLLTNRAITVRKTSQAHSLHPSAEDLLQIGPVGAQSSRMNSETCEPRGLGITGTIVPRLQNVLGTGEVGDLRKDIFVVDASGASYGAVKERCSRFRHELVNAKILYDGGQVHIYTFSSEDRISKDTLQGALEGLAAKDKTLVEKGQPLVVILPEPSMHAYSEVKRWAELHAGMQTTILMWDQLSDAFSMAPTEQRDFCYQRRLMSKLATRLYDPSDLVRQPPTRSTPPSTIVVGVDMTTVSVAGRFQLGLTSVVASHGSLKKDFVSYSGSIRLHQIIKT
ncbi:hypothetical protein LTS18_012254, partial [Coniosporium uncinatum]